MNTESARKASEFTKVIKRDGKAQPREIIVPGHESKQYSVIIRRDNGVLSTECNQVTSNGMVACKGNSKSICYHCLAAIIKAASEKGQEVAFCDSYEKASKLIQINKGRIVKLTSWQSGKEVWLVVYGNLPANSEVKKQVASEEFNQLMQQHAQDLQAMYDENSYSRYGY